VTTTETLEREVVFKRYYDPATGQFMSVDPLVGSTHSAYGYVGDDPVNAGDPLGLYSDSCPVQGDCPTIAGTKAPIEGSGGPASSLPGGNCTPQGASSEYGSVYFSGANGAPGNDGGGIPIGSGTTSQEGQELFGGVLVIGGSGLAGAGIEGVVEGSLVGIGALGAAVPVVGGLALVGWGIYELW